MKTGGAGGEDGRGDLEERDEEAEGGGPQGVHQYKGDIVKNRKTEKGMKEGGGEDGGRREGGREEAWESNPPSLPFYAK